MGMLVSTQSAQVTPNLCANIGCSHLTTRQQCCGACHDVASTRAAAAAVAAAPAAQIENARLVDFGDNELLSLEQVADSSGEPRKAQMLVCSSGILQSARRNNGVVPGGKGR